MVVSFVRVGGRIEKMGARQAATPSSSRGPNLPSKLDLDPFPIHTHDDRADRSIAPVTVHSKSQLGTEDHFRFSI